MRTKKASAAAIVFALCLIMALFIPMSVSARGAIDTEKEASISLTYSYNGYPFEGVEIGIYRVAEVSRSCEFALKGDFENYPVLINNVKTQAEWRQIASTLIAYVTADGIAPTASGYTDSEGNIAFSGLKTGLYLIQGCTVDYDGGYCTFDSFVLCVPTLTEEEDGEQWIYDVEAVPKSVHVVPGPDEIEFTVNKVWKDSGYEHKRPASIEIGLYKDSALIETVVLSSENNWTYSWTALDDSAVWQVVEQNVPEDYSVTIERKGNTFIAANAYDEDDPPPKTGDTSDIYLYVVLICIAGILLLILGIGLGKGKKR